MRFHNSKKKIEKKYEYLIGRIVEASYGKECLQVMIDGVLWIDHNARLADEHEEGKQYKIINIWGEGNLALESIN